MASLLLNIPTTQCQDFMDPKDCYLMLVNVCDPVICPASRCDFGGRYPVADVNSNGIVGGTLVCLPNVKRENNSSCLFNRRYKLHVSTATSQ